MTTQITSRQNGTLKHFARLAREKKYRQSCGEMLCEGEKMLHEALRSGMQVKTVLALAGARDDLGRALLLRAEDTGASMFTAPDALFKLASDVETPQNIIFSCAFPTFESACLRAARRILVLDGLQDPGNMGTILRTADAFALDAVILAEGCADPYAPKVVRATMGAIFRQPIVRLPLEQAIATLRVQGIPVYAAALTEQAVPAGAVRLQNSAVIIGNEGRGVSQMALKRADAHIILPMRGCAESLNAGVAAAILMWEMTKEN